MPPLANTNFHAENVADAFKTLNEGASGLFQARKVGVRVHVPAGVREQMIAAHGQEAVRVLALIDGNVDLDMPNGVANPSQTAQHESLASTAASVFADKSLESKLQELEAIRTTLRWHRRGRNPRLEFTLLLVAFSFAILMGVDFLVPGLWQVPYSRSLFAAILIGWVCYLRSSKPRSMRPIWEQQIARYRPVNKDAHQSLIKKMCRFDAKERDPIYWIAQEREALMNAARGTEATHPAFEDKVA